MRTYRLQIVGASGDYGRGPLALVVAQAVNLLESAGGYTCVIRPVDGLSVIRARLSKGQAGIQIELSDEPLIAADRWVSSIPEIITRTGATPCPP